MTLSISNESKNAIAVTNEAKGRSLTWPDATFTWNSAQAQTDTWTEQGKLVITAESKNALTVTNETKL